jgi:hypothetical protein
MISRQTAALVSGPAVGCMLFVAWHEFSEGKQLGDIHLITPAPLAASSISTGSVGSMVPNFTITRISGVPCNTIADADYIPVADSRILRHDGLTHPSESPNCLIGNVEAAKALGVEPVLFVST